MSETKKVFTLDEVQKHKSADDAWIILDDMVYDVTTFLNDHPGGIGPIMQSVGKDASEEFNLLHGASAKQLAQKYLVGALAQKSKL